MKYRVIPGLRMAGVVEIYSNAIVCQTSFLASSEICTGDYVKYPKNAFTSIRENLRELEMVTVFIEVRAGPMFKLSG